MKFKANAPFILLLAAMAWGQGDAGKDYRFYNLEKEYRELKTVVFQPREAKALELKLVVENMLSIYGTAYVNEKENALYVTDTPEMAAKLESTLKSLDRKGVTAGNNLVSRTIPLKHVVASDILTLLNHKLSRYGTLLNYSDQNALLVTDIESKIDEVFALVQSLDIPVPHIQIESYILEADAEYFSKKGVNIFEWLSNTSSQLMVRKAGSGGTGISLGVSDPVSPGVPPGFADATTLDVGKNTLVLGARVSLSDLVGLLTEDGKAKVLACPRLVTKNNNNASLSAQEMVPFKFQPPGLPGAQAPNSAPFVISGVSLQILPVIQLDSCINMQIYPTITDLTGWDPHGMPIVGSRALSTEISVKSGEVFVLGGLRRSEVIKKRTGVPVLRSIPLLRYLFSSTTDVKIEREVVILVRPQILAGNSFKAEKKQLEIFESEQGKK